MTSSSRSFSRPAQWLADESRRFVQALRTQNAARRMLAFGVALAILVIGAHGGAPKTRVVLLLAGFVVVSTVWIRGMYADDIVGTPWVMPRWGGWAFFAAGLITLVVFVLTSLDGLGLFGLVGMYFGAGALLMRWRRSAPTRVAHEQRLGAVLIIVGVVMFFVGAIWLGHGNAAIPGLLMAVAVLGPFPLGLSVLAALAIDHQGVKGVPLRWWERLGIPLGVGLFVLSTAVAVLISHSPWLLVLMVIIGVLMIAQASATQADIVFVMVALALVGVTPAGVSGPPPPTGSNGDQVLVAFGDSYMSGEGASVYFRGTDDGGGDQCRRSPTSWVVMASHEPPFTGIEDLSCSGATTLNVVHASPQTKASRADVQDGEPGRQLDQYADLAAKYQSDGANFHPALVAISLGGNDAGFSTVGIMCVAPGECDVKKDLWLGALPDVKAHLEAAYTQIAAEFPSTPVVVAAYPNPIKSENNCGDLALTLRERTFIQNFVNGLNQQIQEAAADHGFYYLGAMADSLAQANLQLCDPLNDGQPGINFIGLRSVNGPAEQRFNPQRWAHSSFHPNQRGHAAMLTTFEQWLALNHPTSAPARLAIGAPTSAAPVTQLCDVYSSGSDGCRPQGTAWAERQLGGLLFPGGFLALFAALGAWWASVVFFGWRRRALSALREPDAPPAGP